MNSLKLNIVLLIAISVFYSCGSSSDSKEKILKEPSTIEQLGELLFNDSILSRGNQVSCASCHKPEFAFADNTPVSFGVDSLKGGRNTPSAMNQSGRVFQFWDGRMETLEEQAAGPIENPVEMDLPLSAAVDKLNKHEQYRKFFIKIFGHPADKKSVTDAIAAFERTLETSNSAFDNYMSGKDTTQFTESAKRGREIFNVKGKCFDCHFGPDFTTDLFRNIGIFNGKDLNDSGRFVVTRDPKDIGRFKTPGLRNVAMTAPYMHNGMHKTLREVIDYYNEPDKFISNSVNRDTLLAKPLGLTEQDKKDLEAFLVSLTDARFLKKK
ncbi:MAG: cytochrome-c peroxidase [Sphingobacteriaceae bacterium]|nr:cytochrome-c peroxidase [Sphingobacteriaceae bacterium]